jgi:hypothetical protein
MDQRSGRVCCSGHSVTMNSLDLLVVARYYLNFLQTLFPTKNSVKLVTQFCKVAIFVLVNGFKGFENEK